MPSIRKPPNSRVPVIFLTFCVFLSCFPGCIKSATVTLDSITIYKTHELLEKPTVYFKCKGDQNKTVLPDVKEKNQLYKFNGEESWQPLTKIEGKKCKRCGLYEADTFKSDDVFEEWELCPADFDGPDGKYKHIKEKEFNATFLCSKCDTTGSKTRTHEEAKEKGMHFALVILIVLAVIVVLAVCIAGGVVGYKHWQKKKRQQEQARFLKLFEDGDDIEDELGLDHVI